MADFAYLPNVDHETTYGPPPTVSTVLADGKEIVRQLHANAPEKFAREFDVDGTEFDLIKAFFELKGAITSFSMLSYDKYGTPTQEVTVRFDGPMQWTRVGEDWFRVRLTFRRIY